MPPIDPSYCRQKILAIHGERGAQFLRDLPALLAECAGRWDLTIQPPFPIESYSYVAPAVRAGGEPVVLKVGVPDSEFIWQIDALRLWDGSGACRLLDADPERGFMLMERVLPGVSLKNAALADDEHVVAVAVSTMQRLWRPAPDLAARVPAYNFPTVAGWFGDLQKLRARFDGSTGPLPAAPIERAERLSAELMRASGPPMLIHGDMNWGNILRGQRQPWLVIDPKGVVGDPLYDVATFLNDPPEDLTGPELRRLLSRRIAQIAEMLGEDRARVRGWAYAHLILAGYWSYEEHGEHGWQSAFAAADLYEEV